MAFTSAPLAARRSAGLLPVYMKSSSPEPSATLAAEPPSKVRSSTSIAFLLELLLQQPEVAVERRT